MGLGLGNLGVKKIGHYLLNDGEDMGKTTRNYGEILLCPNKGRSYGGGFLRGLLDIGCLVLGCNLKF